MLAHEVSHPDASFAVHRDEGTDRAQLGAIIDDVFIPFFETKLSLFDHFHRQGQEQKDAQASEQAAADRQASEQAAADQRAQTYPTSTAATQAPSEQ